MLWQQQRRQVRGQASKQEAEAVPRTSSWPRHAWLLLTFITMFMSGQQPKEEEAAAGRGGVREARGVVPVCASLHHHR